MAHVLLPLFQGNRVTFRCECLHFIATCFRADLMKPIGDGCNETLLDAITAHHKEHAIGARSRKPGFYPVWEANPTLRDDKEQTHE